MIFHVQWAALKRLADGLAVLRPSPSSRSRCALAASGCSMLESGRDQGGSVVLSGPQPVRVALAGTVAGCG